MKKLLNRETITYLIVGVCTTLVSFGAYWLYSRVFGVANEHVAKFLSTLTAMLFAFYPNKVWVFQSRKNDAKSLFHEALTFFSTRAVSSFIIEQGLFFIFIEIVQLYDLLANAIVVCIVVILNYIAAKFIVFRKAV